MIWKKKTNALQPCANTAAYEQRLHASSSQSHRFCIGIMCKNSARKDTTAHRERLAKTWAAYAQRRIPHSKRLGRRSICGAVLLSMCMPMLELACSAKAPNPEAQHATTLRGNVLEPCLRKCYGRAVTKALCLLNLGSAATQRRIPHGKRYGRYGSCTAALCKYRCL